MKSTTPRICPQCGATNTGRSLYCAECGADLSQPPDPTMTRPLGSASDQPGTSGADQRTETYAPAWNQSWSGNDRDAASSGTNAHDAVTPVRTPVTPVATGQPAAIKPTATKPASSSRGFYLGLIAILIIVAIALVLVWLSLVQPNL
jgi:hypothetical protein